MSSPAMQKLSPPPSPPPHRDKPSPGFDEFILCFWDKPCKDLSASYYMHYKLRYQDLSRQILVPRGGGGRRRGDAGGINLTRLNAPAPVGLFTSINTQHHQVFLPPPSSPPLFFLYLKQWAIIVNLYRLLLLLLLLFFVLFSAS